MNYQCSVKVNARAEVRKKSEKSPREIRRAAVYFGAPRVEYAADCQMNWTTILHYRAFTFHFRYGGCAFGFPIWRNRLVNGLEILVPYHYFITT